MTRPLRAMILLLCLAASRCARIPAETMRIDGRIVTVDNHSADEWRDVEIWVNGYFRATAPAIAAHGRLQVPLNAFVSGYAPDGTLVEHRKDFSKSALSAFSERGHQ